MKDILEYQPVKNCIDKHSEGNRKCLKSSILDFVRFSNDLESLDKEITPDDLIEEAERDVVLTQKRIENYYLWMQGKTVEGYKPRKKSAKASSAYQKAFSYIRSFYSYNRIAFDKSWSKTIKEPEQKQAIKNDNNYAFYKVDEKGEKIYFDRELLQNFLSNLKLRDQAITLALLSSSQDSGDLFELNIGDVRKQQSRKRIFFEKKRGKTNVLFRAFFSAEATNYIRRYIAQERMNAEDKEPLFTVARNHGQVIRMTPNHLSSIFRDAAKKTGIKWVEGEWNPFRPKRLRHLFRTACDTAGVPELYVNAFMGHVNGQGQDYSEIDPAKLELEYLRVEPYLTVYGESEEVSSLRRDIEEKNKQLQELVTNVVTENIGLKTKVTKLETDLKAMDKRMGHVTHALGKLLTEKEYRELHEDEERSREDNAEENSSVITSEEIEKAKKNLQP